MLQPIEVEGQEKLLLSSKVAVHKRTINPALQGLWTMSALCDLAGSILARFQLTWSYDPD